MVLNIYCWQKGDIRSEKIEDKSFKLTAISRTLFTSLPTEYIDYVNTLTVEDDVIIERLANKNYTGMYLTVKGGKKGKRKRTKVKGRTKTVKVMNPTKAMNLDFEIERDKVKNKMDVFREIHGIDTKVACHSDNEDFKAISTELNQRWAKFFEDMINKYSPDYKVSYVHDVEGGYNRIKTKRLILVPKDYDISKHINIDKYNHSQLFGITLKFKLEKGYDNRGYRSHFMKVDYPSISNKKWSKTSRKTDTIKMTDLNRYLSKFNYGIIENKIEMEEFRSEEYMDKVYKIYDTKVQFYNDELSNYVLKNVSKKLTVDKAYSRYSCSQITLKTNKLNFYQIGNEVNFKIEENEDVDSLDTKQSTINKHLQLKFTIKIRTLQVQYNIELKYNDIVEKDFSKFDKIIEKISVIGEFWQKTLNDGGEFSY